MTSAPLTTQTAAVPSAKPTPTAAESTAQRGLSFEEVRDAYRETIAQAAALHTVLSAGEAIHHEVLSWHPEISTARGARSRLAAVLTSPEKLRVALLQAATDPAVQSVMETSSLAIRAEQVRGDAIQAIRRAIFVYASHLGGDLSLSGVCRLDTAEKLLGIRDEQGELQGAWA